jgi:hypothetical protein
MELLEAIKRAVEDHHNHITEGYLQWYVDEHSIDCDAKEFWKVVERVIREASDAS